MLKVSNTKNVFWPYAYAISVHATYYVSCPVAAGDYYPLTKGMKWSHKNAPYIPIPINFYVGNSFILLHGFLVIKQAPMA